MSLFQAFNGAESVLTIEKQMIKVKLIRVILIG